MPPRKPSRSEDLTKTTVASLLAEYEPTLAAELRRARKKLRALFPRGYELVYDNYNALVFAISTSERTSDCLVSVVGYPKWVTLFFAHGKGLADPAGLLQGSGSRIRSIRLATAEDLDRREVRALIAAATRPHASAFRAAPKLATVVKSVAKTRRPRRQS